MGFWDLRLPTGQFSNSAVPEHKRDDPEKTQAQSSRGPHVAEMKFLSPPPQSMCSSPRATSSVPVSFFFLLTRSLVYDRASKGRNDQLNERNLGRSFKQHHWGAGDLSSTGSCRWPESL